MVVDAQIVKTEVADAPGARVTVDVLRVAVSPVGVDVVKDTVPEKPLTLATVITVELSHPPRTIVTLAKLEEMVKSPPALLKTAVCVLSGTGPGVPFAMLTHRGGLLVCVPHPVWKDTLVPELVPVTL